MTYGIWLIQRIAQLGIIDVILDVLKIEMKGTLRTEVLAIVEYSTDHFLFAKKSHKLTGTWEECWSTDGTLSTPSISIVDFASHVAEIRLTFSTVWTTAVSLKIR